MSTWYCHIDSPLGRLLLTGNGEALTRLHMNRQKYAERVGATWRRDEGQFAGAREQIAAYFAGDLTTFDLSLAPTGSEFQQRVWQALRDIGFGRTESYGALARRIGHPDGARAVGAANGCNPIGIIIHCHRVIGANGSLTGYGGGIERKRRLLEYEARTAGGLQPAGAVDLQTSLF